MDKNLVSVVIPAYNKPEYTNKTIESVIAQTHRPIEIILSDDNSPNSLKALIDEKRAKCDSGLEIKYYRQKENLNYYWNFQFVLSKAIGKYMVMLDHDDWLIDKHFFSDSIKTIEEMPDCYLSIANTFMENTPETFLNFYYQNWHYVDGNMLMKKNLFTNTIHTIHPHRAAVMLRFDKLKELNYMEYFISRETGQRLNLMPDEAFVSICLLASIGKIALTGRVVSVRGEPADSASKSTSWRKSGGETMFIPFFLLYKHFLLTGCKDGIQTMIQNFLIVYPCHNINFKILKYLSYDHYAVFFMVLSATWFNLKRIILSPLKIRTIVVMIAKKLLF